MKDQRISESTDVLQHGRDCPKAPHYGGGYLHAGDDDKPYDVDGIAYCGRCHCWLGSAAFHVERTAKEQV